MKRLSFLLITFMLPLFISAQEAPRNTNMIIIHTNMPKDSCFDYVAQDLLNHGFSLNMINEKFGMIKTDERSVKGASIKITSHITGDKTRSDINITGLVLGISVNIYGGGVSSGQGSSWETIRKIKGKSGIYAKAWIWMNDYAKTLPGTIEYKTLN